MSDSTVLHVVLVEPEIPPNTGNVARLCAATDTCLHLVGPLGFRLTDSRMRRAGLDYWDSVRLVRHDSLEKFLLDRSSETLYFLSKHGSLSYTSARFVPGSYLVFGSETRGLPAWVFESFPDRIFRIPMMNSAVRSLNLSNSVAIVLYEGLRQLGHLKV